MSAAILPDTEAPEFRPFWDAAREGRLVVQQCAACGKLRFPPHPGCPSCRSHAAGWQRVSGRGTLWSWVVVHGPTLPAFQPFVPFPVALVALVEGDHLRMVGNLLAAPGASINSVDPAGLEVGRPLAAIFREVEGVPLPAWIPA